MVSGHLSAEVQLPSLGSGDQDRGDYGLTSALAPQDDLEVWCSRHKWARGKQGAGERSSQAPSARQLLWELVQKPLHTAPALQDPCPPPAPLT